MSEDAREVLADAHELVARHVVLDDEEAVAPVGSDLLVRRLCGAAGRSGRVAVAVMVERL